TFFGLRAEKASVATSVELTTTGGPVWHPASSSAAAIATPEQANEDPRKENETSDRSLADVRRHHSNRAGLVQACGSPFSIRSQMAREVSRLRPARRIR